MPQNVKRIFPTLVFIACAILLVMVLYFGEGLSDLKPLFVGLQEIEEYGGPYGGMCGEIPFDPGSEKCCEDGPIGNKYYVCEKHDNWQDQSCCHGECFTPHTQWCCDDRDGEHLWYVVNKVGDLTKDETCCGGIPVVSEDYQCCKDGPEGNEKYICGSDKECCGGECTSHDNDERCCRDGPEEEPIYKCDGRYGCCNKGSCIDEDTFCGVGDENEKKCMICEVGECVDNDGEDCSSDGSSCRECLDGGCMATNENYYCGGGGVYDLENPDQICGECDSGVCVANTGMSCGPEGSGDDDAYECKECTSEKKCENVPNDDEIVCGDLDGCNVCDGGACNKVDGGLCTLPKGVTPGFDHTCDICQQGTCAKKAVNCFQETGDTSQCWRCQPSDNTQGWECVGECLTNCQVCAFPGELGNPWGVPICTDTCDSEALTYCSICNPTQEGSANGVCTYYCRDCEDCQPPQNPQEWWTGNPSECVEGCPGTDTKCFCGDWKDECVDCTQMDMVCDNNECKTPCEITSDGDTCSECWECIDQVCEKEADGTACTTLIGWGSVPGTCQDGECVAGGCGGMGASNTCLPCQVCINSECQALEGGACMTDGGCGSCSAGACTGTGGNCPA
ncbi:MAG: hypothetical protein ABH834_04870 [Candidatus Altiarchaeota archaeon]